jgi:hypothetical protein
MEGFFYGVIAILLYIVSGAVSCAVYVLFLLALGLVIAAVLRLLQWMRQGR